MIKLAAALAAVPAFCVALVAGTGVLVVDVREGGPGGHHFVVPVPLLLAQAGAGFAPRGAAARLDLPQLQKFLPAAERMLDALGDAPDGELVRVEERSERVLVTKAGQSLRIEVHGGKEDVSATLPLGAVREVLHRAKDGHLTPADLVAVLRHARLTNIADVRDGGDHVKVSVW